MQDPAPLKRAWNELTLACSEVVQTRQAPAERLHPCSMHQQLVIDAAL
jgi:hypothetical protein